MTTGSAFDALFQPGGDLLWGLIERIENRSWRVDRIKTLPPPTAALVRLAFLKTRYDNGGLLYVFECDHPACGRAICDALAHLGVTHIEMPATPARVWAAGAAVALHPLATLTVRQAVAPLNHAREIDRFGEAPVAGVRRFVATLSTTGLAGASALAPATVQEDFAPGQFFEMSDDQRLAAPSYEPMVSGLAVPAPASAFDLAVGLASPLEYDTRLIDAQAAKDEPSPPHRLDDRLLALHLRAGAAGRSALRGGDDTQRPAFAAVRAAGFVLVDESLKRADAGAARQGFAETAGRAAAARRGLRVVPEFEQVGQG